MYDPMKIVILTSAPYPKGMAITQHIHLLARGLVQIGHSVEVWIISPTETGATQGRNSESVGVHDRITYRYLGGEVDWAGTRLQRMLQIHKSYRITLRFLREMKDSFVISWTSGLFFLAFVRAVTRRRNTLVLLKTEHPLLGKKPGIGRVLYKLACRFIYRAYDGLILISRPLEEACRKIVKKNIPVGLMPITIDTKEFESGHAPAANDYVFASGNLSEEKDGIHTIIKAFSVIADSFPELSLHISGDNYSDRIRESLLDLISSQKLESRVKLLGYISRDEYLEQLAGARVCVLAKPPGFQAEYCMPFKLGEYLASGRPVIVSETGVVRDYLKDSVHAFISNEHTPENYAEIMQDVFKNSEKSFEVGRNGRALALKVFNETKNAQIVVDLLNNAKRTWVSL